MRILLLGHRGMLGSQLMERLSHRHDVVGNDIDEFNIAIEEDCRRVVVETQPDVVINAAAYTDVDGSETAKELCFAVNAEGVRNVALACRPDKIRIIHFSTDYVFDGQKEMPYREEDACRPLSTYGEAKRAGEKYLQQISENCLIIRTAWLYGENGKNFVNAILGKAREIGALQVVDDQKGAPTYTRDLAAAVERLLSGGHSGIMHVTNRGTCSWYDFARKILEYAGIHDVPVTRIRSDQLNRLAVRPSNTVLSCAKFIEETGKTMRFWQLALQDYMIRERLMLKGNG